MGKLLLRLEKFIVSHTVWWSLWFFALFLPCLYRLGFTGEWQLQADMYIALQWNNVPYFDVKQGSASKYLHSHTVLIWWDNLSFRFSNFIAILCVWFQLPPQGRRLPGPAWRARTRTRLTSGGKRRGFASPFAVWSSPRAFTGLCCVWLASTRCVWP